jgi:hypothetical protein
MIPDLYPSAHNSPSLTPRMPPYMSSPLALREQRIDISHAFFTVDSEVTVQPAGRFADQTVQPAGRLQPTTTACFDELQHPSWPALRRIPHRRNGRSASRTRLPLLSKAVRAQVLRPPGPGLYSKKKNFPPLGVVLTPKLLIASSNVL